MKQIVHTPTKLKLLMLFNWALSKIELNVVYTWTPTHFNLQIVENMKFTNRAQLDQHNVV